MFLKDMKTSDLDQLGGFLGISYIKRERFQPDSYPKELVASWLRREDDVSIPSWNVLVDALKEIGQMGIAQKITSKYSVKDSEPKASHNTDQPSSSSGLSTGVSVQNNTGRRHSCLLCND